MSKARTHNVRMSVKMYDALADTAHTYSVSVADVIRGYIKIGQTDPRVVGKFDQLMEVTRDL